MQVVRGMQFSTVVSGELAALVRRNAVVVFTVGGCCMCHVVKQLLLGLGVGPALVEIDGGSEIHGLLLRLSSGRRAVVPAVFVGGEYLGGVEAVMACHISGALVPLLKNAGALWL
ncbi:glutaredoxin family protein [Striga asiatica]|uniref:Glutaredoxin family protein n=1 Tax=Striga asiatica TaxID=4170 RepID=A0A5A7PV91_STRAF|nr:glutaredoxin family protein [Striga asiatica]